MNTYDTSTLIGVINGLDPFETFLLTMFFPEVITFETSTIDYDVVAPNSTLAPFVSPLVAGRADTSNGYSTRKFKPAYLKPKHVVDPEKVIARKAGEQIGGGLFNGDRRRAIIADNLNDERESIIRRLEWMCSQVLRTGKTVVSGENYPTVEVDFQRAAGNTITLTGTNVWTDTANAKPLDQMEAWNAQSEAPITDFVMDALSWKNLIKFQEVKDLLDTRRGSESSVELGPDNAKWVSYKGMLGSFHIWVYTGYYTDDAGAKQLYVPDNTVIGASSAVEGVRAFGAILDPAAGYQALEMFPKNWVSDDPAVENTMTQSAPLMVPKRPNATIAVKTA